MFFFCGPSKLAFLGTGYNQPMNDERTARRLTVGDLREHLALFPDHYELIFGSGEPGKGGFTFYRTKMRGPELVQIAFEELYELTETGQVGQPPMNLDR